MELSFIHTYVSFDILYLGPFVTGMFFNWDVLYLEHL